MIAHPSPTPSRDGHLRKLWPLVLAVLLLTIVPLVIDHWASRDQAGANNSGDQTVTAMSARVIRNTQKTTLLVVAALSLLYFRKLVPVLSSVVLASLSGLLVAAEMVLILWLVYGGLASVGMPGLVWSPNPATMIHAAFSVTLSLYWMLYLLFVRDFEVHRHQPDRHVWVRFAPVLEASGLPGLLGSKTDGADSVLRLRWFLGYATCLAAAPQYVSAPTISWPFRDPSAHQVWSATELLMNFTEPSQNPTLTPPGWLLVAEIAAPNPPLALE